MAMNADIQFIQEDDEFADIAAGESTSADSLADEILESPEQDASTAQAETVASEAPVNSAHDQQLVVVLRTIKEEIRKHKRPLCYVNGDFWMRAKHPVFLLAAARTHGLHPNCLYERDVFVWLPSYLPGAPETFKCTCVDQAGQSRRLSKKGSFIIFTFHVFYILKSAQKVTMRIPLHVVFDASPRTIFFSPIASSVMTPA